MVRRRGGSRREQGWEAAVETTGEGHHRLSPVAENYLQGIYVLREQGTPVTPGHLADYLRRLPLTEGLGTSLPSVTGMVRRLARAGLVELPKGKEIRLSRRGEVAAGDVVRRHRLAECMVVEVLGMDLAEAHREAHRLEHGISHYLEERIAERLGHPRTCPFGHPIPGSGAGDPPQDMPLDRAEGRREYVITRVPEQDAELLRFLVEEGLIPGRRFTVTEVAPYRGVLVLRVDRRDIALGYQVARLLRAKAAQ